MQIRANTEFRSFYNTSHGDLDRATFDYNKTNGKHDVRNKLLSNAFGSRYNYMGGGVGLRVIIRGSK